MQFPRIRWPLGKSFAFTIIDDPDSQTLETGRRVYSFLAENGFRTTKLVWPIRGTGTPSDHGTCCDDPEYAQWVQELQAQGFEIGFHNATSHTSPRAETERGLDTFKQLFGANPGVLATHYYSQEALHWGDQRVTGGMRLLYNLLTFGRNRGRYHGHESNHPYFWGDLCKERIKYARNFTFAEINTLKACPYMPYHDPLRPYVNYWFSASEGSDLATFLERIAEDSQDRLEQEGGLSIVYTHFGHHYVKDGTLSPRFQELMQRLSARNGWFVPVSAVLDFVLAQRGALELSDPQRAELERRWLTHKIRFGNA
jgi:hypothetical protein